MKRFVYLLFLLFIPFVGMAQTAGTNLVLLDSVQQNVLSSLLRIDSLIDVNNRWIEQVDIELSLKQRYKLYLTENMYTLLRLDTKTGKIEQVQWTLDSDNEGTFTINDSDLTYGWGYGSGSFELYPTRNMYQFILIDKTDGRMWHVQWGIESEKRWIRRIY